MPLAADKPTSSDPAEARRIRDGDGRHVAEALHLRGAGIRRSPAEFARRGGARSNLRHHAAEMLMERILRGDAGGAPAIARR